MAIRLKAMKRVLKPTGSIYLHCDPTASHYLKMVMDAIFGEKNFRNEISWCYKRMAAKGQRHFSKCHDIILWYGIGNPKFKGIIYYDPNSDRYASGSSTTLT